MLTGLLACELGLVQGRLMTQQIISSLVQSALSAASHAESTDRADVDVDDFDGIVRNTTRSFARVVGNATTDGMLVYVVVALCPVITVSKY